MLSALRHILLLLLLFPAGPAFGKMIPDDSRTSGLGGSGVMLAEGMAFMPNQAALASLRKLCFGVCAQSLFFLPELTSGAIFLYLPSGSGTFGFSYRDYGNSAYRENHASLVFGKGFGERFRAGIGMDYSSVHQSGDYGNLRAFIPAIGIQVIPVDDITLGFHISNPAGQCYYPRGNLRIPSIFRAGIGYSAGKEILVCFEFKKETGFRSVYTGGMEYLCGNILTIRLGLSSSKMAHYALGLGFRQEHVRMELAFVHHPVLGYSPSITLAYYR